MYWWILLGLSTVFLTSHGDVVYPCVTPNSENAYCISLFSCPHMMKLLGSVEPSSIDFVRKSICLGCQAGDFMVCCGTPKNQSDTISTSEQVQSVITTATTLDPPVAPTPDRLETSQDIQKYSEKVKLLPGLTYCGLQHTDDRFYNDTDTALDEFPWLVHIRFSDLEYESEYGDRCSGVLISKRYVLTDAYCGSEGIKVKLGQHSTNKNVSCIEDPHFPECSEPTIEVRIEEKIQDDTIKPQDKGPYDFALLRLAKTVFFTDFIRPICLPIEESKRPKQLDTLTFSGWGASNATDIKKKRLVYDVVDAETCYKEKQWLEGNIRSAKVSFICVTPQQNNSEAACNGEHGGPFMFSQRHQWFLEGIVVDASAEGVPDSCSKDKPVNGIRITPKTINWILETIRK